jgi:anti-sigma B factor antagonist
VSEPVSVRVHRDDRTTTIVLSGEVDLAAHPALADALAEAMTELAASRLVVDLGAVTFIDSSGLSAAIVLPARAADDAGITFNAISGPGVARALQVSGLDRFVHPDDT